MGIKNFIGFAFGPIASAVLGLITVPVFSWVFSPEDVGRLNILHMVISFCLLLLVLGLDQAYVREFHETSNTSQLLKLCFRPGFYLLLVSASVSLPFSNNLSSWLFCEVDPWFYPLILVCILTSYISRFLSLILRMQERGLAFSISQIMPKASQLILLGVVLWTGATRNFLTLLWITVASTLTVVVVYAWNTRKEWLLALETQPNPDQTRALLKFGLPLMISGLAYWGLTATSTLVLRSQSTLSELGIYSVASKFAGAATIFQSIFTVIWAPMVYKWVAEGVDMVRVDTVARQALSVVCAIFVVTGIFSWLTDYILPVHYISVKYLVLCAIAPPLLYTLSEITCVGIRISRRTKLSVWVTLAALAANVLLNLWLVPKHGASGAVMANALAYMVFFVAGTEASAHVWRQFPRNKLYLCVGFTITFAVATVLFGPTALIHYALFWLAALPLVGWLFCKEWTELISAGRLCFDQKISSRMLGDKSTYSVKKK